MPRISPTGNVGPNRSINSSGFDLPEKHPGDHMFELGPPPSVPEGWPPIRNIGSLSLEEPYSTRPQPPEAPASAEAIFTRLTRKVGRALVHVHNKWWANH